MKTLITYENISNILKSCGKSIENLEKDLHLAPKLFEDWKDGLTPSEDIVWAIINQLNHYLGYCEVQSYSGYPYETISQVKDIPSDSVDLIIPEDMQFEWMAYSGGIVSLTQQDVDDWIKFSKKLKGH